MGFVGTVEDLFLFLFCFSCRGRLLNGRMEVAGEVQLRHRLRLVSTPPGRGTRQAAGADRLVYDLLMIVHIAIALVHCEPAVCAWPALRQVGVRARRQGQAGLFLICSCLFTKRLARL